MVKGCSSMVLVFFFHTVQISGAIWTGARPPRGTRALAAYSLSLEREGERDEVGTGMGMCDLK